MAKQTRMAGARPAAKATQKQKARQERRETRAAAPQRAQQSTPLAYTGQLAQFATPEGFGAGAFMRARAAGLTDADIKSGVEDLRRQGSAIGERVNVALNPAQYGNEMAVRGAAAGGFVDTGSNTSYGMRAVFLPEGSTAGGGKGVVWASGPMTDEQIYNMYAGKSRESYVLPAGVNAPGEAYRAPAGVPYIDPSASPSEQARMAAGTFRLGAPAASQTASVQAPAPARTSTVPQEKRIEKFSEAKRLSQKAKSRSTKDLRDTRQFMAQPSEKYFGSGKLGAAKYGFASFR